jgi:hypothetical protein
LNTEITPEQERQQMIERLSRAFGFNIGTFSDERIDEIIVHAKKYIIDENHLRDNFWIPIYWNHVTNPTHEIINIQNKEYC